MLCSFQIKSTIVVYKLRVLGHFPPGIFMGLGLLGYFGLKIKAEQTAKIHKDIN